MEQSSCSNSANVRNAAKEFIKFTHVCKLYTACNTYAWIRGIDRYHEVTVMIMALKTVPRILNNFLCHMVNRSNNRRNRVSQFHSFSSKLKNCQKEEEQFYTRLARTKDHDTVMRVMCDSFFKFEPSIVNLGISGREMPALNDIMRKGMKEGMTIVAVRHEDEAVVGAAINTGSCSWGPKHLVRYAECCQCGPVQDLLKFYAYVSAKPQLWQKYCEQKIFECTFVSVTEECQGQGLAKRLIRESWYLARDCGYRLFRIDCTSRYTAKVAESFGWECVYSLPFQEYIPNGEKIFKHIQEPHTTVNTFVDQLQLNPCATVK